LIRVEESRLAPFLAVFLLALLPFATTYTAAVSQSNFASQGPSHKLDVALSGAVLSAGEQRYATSGGALLSASLLGHKINVAASSLTYSFHAKVSGLDAEGRATLRLSGWAAGGERVSLHAETDVDRMVPAAAFPLGCIVGINCTSAIPAFFAGRTHVDVRIGDSRVVRTMQFRFESPYLNPWGGPIAIGSSDGAILLVAKYSRATIAWRDVVTGGLLEGTYSGKPVAGLFSLIVNSRESLRAGTEVDRGAVAFANMTTPILDSTGAFAGVSVIPKAGAIPCWKQMHLPPGTCQLTGLNSTGGMDLKGDDIEIFGGYATVWAIPAVAFASTVVATVVKS
jgi:hypothetical protein